MHLTQHTCTSQPIKRDFRAKCFLSSSRKIAELLSFTFTMSYYSYCLLSRCDKQLGSHLVLVHETILGLTRMATEHWLRKIRSPMYSLFHGFWQRFISIEACRDCIPALASSCKKTIDGFLCLLIVFLKSKTHQLNLKDVIKLNRNLR